MLVSGCPATPGPLLRPARDGVLDHVPGHVAAAGRLDPSPLYTHSFRLNDINQAFETVASRPEGFLKALVTP